MTAKNGLLEFKCVDCSKTYNKMFDEGLSKKFKNTYEFCNRKNDKFCLILWKALYPYEYIDGWEILNETPLPTKQEFYSKLIMEIIIDTDYKHAKKTGTTLDCKIYANLKSCMNREILCCLQMYSKVSEISALKLMY